MGTFDTIKKQERELSKLSQALLPKKNTVIPHDWLKYSSSHYQAHLERIEDYLLEGPGIWWRHTENGVEFLDIEISNLSTTPILHYFRKESMSDVDIHLLEKWEACLDNQYNYQLNKLH